jgi:hypothetical protein
MRFIAMVAGLAVTFTGAAPAHAAAVDARTTIRVQVASNVSITGYGIDNAIKVLNSKTTRTRLVRGRCTTGAARCIRVDFGALPKSNWYAMGDSPTATTVGYIRLSAKSKQLTAPLRKRLFLHELGHARGLAHAGSCATVMFSWIICNGKLVPYAFSARESAFLRGQ